MDCEIGIWLAALDGPNPAAMVDALDGSTTPPTEGSRRPAEPSTPVKRAAPTEELSLEDSAMDPAEAKRVKRMRRNRESAAMSRERKKQYIETLEQKVASLQETVKKLRAENHALRSGGTPVEGESGADLPDDASDCGLPPLVPQTDNDSESDAASLDAFLEPFVPSSDAGDAGEKSNPTAQFGKDLAMYDISVIGDDALLASARVVG